MLPLHFNLGDDRIMDLNSSERPNEPTRRSKAKPIKHRSSQACQACRARKVRCDVLTNGSQCTNCRLDRLECVVLASRRGRNRHTRQNRASQAQPSRPKQAAIPLVGPDSDATKIQAQATQKDIVTPTGSNGDAGVVPVCVTFDQDSDQDGDEQQLTGKADDRHEAAHALPEAYDGILTPGIATDPSEQPHTTLDNTPLPSFIAPLSARVPSEDIDILARKRAFVVPEPDLQFEILRGYLFSVQPFLPVLDAREFISAMLSNGEKGKISLLLFQAVMFAGLHSLQPSIIQRLGFETTKQAREAFFNRVRILYDFNVESNSIAVFQSLLLMSSWYSKWHDRRHTWHWTGLAYDVARNIGLQREPTTTHTSEKVCRFRKRLWWSLYIRDRMIALGTRRPMRIRDDDFNVKMLTLSDFDVSAFEEHDERVNSLVLSTEEMTSTAQMCIQLAKLSICIGHVVSSQYTTLTNQPDIPHTMMVVSRRDQSAPEELDLCDQELVEWYRDLGESVQRHNSTASNWDPQSCSEVHWIVLNLTHLTAVNVLHRARALSPSLEVAGVQVAQKSSRSKVKDAARGMTRLTHNMLQNDQARHLGLIGVTAIIAACLSHMLDISSSDEDVRDASTLRLYQSIQVLQYLKGIYASADAAASFLASLTGQAGISIPAQVAISDTEMTHVDTRSRVSPSARLDQNSHLRRSDASFSTLYAPPGPSSNLEQLRSTHGLHTPTSGIEGGPGNTIRRLQGPVRAEILPAAHVRSSGSTPGSRKHDLFDTSVASEQDIFQIDTTFGGPWNAANAPPPFNWSSNPEVGMDLGLMSFNYDFYSNAFGFLDGHGEGLQQY